MKYFLLIICLLFSLAVFSQSAQGEYLEGKRQFLQGNYTVAAATFKSLVNDPTFGSYASFYFGLSSYRVGDKKAAYDMWLQVEKRFSGWSETEELTFWLAKTGLELERYRESIPRAMELDKATADRLLTSHFRFLSYEEVFDIHKVMPENKAVAKFLMQKIEGQPTLSRDQELLATLSRRFDLKPQLKSASLPIVKKDTYAIATVLPFMYEGLENPTSVIRNSIVLDLYQGMTAGVKELEKQNIQVALFPYDTRKSKAITERIIKDQNLSKADLIISPLYAGPNEVIQKFSKENKINAVNPLSANRSIIGDNDFGMLFKPSYETQGEEAALFAIETYRENKKVCIYFETARDSIIANSYKQTLEDSGFFVLQFQRINNESAQQIQIDFTEKYEIRLDTMFNRSEIDSIRRIPGRYVKTRPLRAEKGVKILKDREGKDIIETYEERFVVVEDSVGHMFAATSSNLLANNFISLAEVRIDTIGLIGYGDWLDFSLLSYDQLQDLELSFLSPSFIDRETEAFDKLADTFRSTYKKEPSDYHFVGYELIVTMGRLLNENGKYLQRGLIPDRVFPGIVLPGLKYGNRRDNQVVPINTLEDFSVKRQN